MRAAVITHSSTFESRADAVGRFLEKRGYEVIRLYSDFDHHRKKTLSRSLPGHVYLHMLPYSRNLSARRLFSIHSFAEHAADWLEERMKQGEGFDLVYILLPANSFVPAAERLRKKYRFHLVYDVIDLWPESLPLKKLGGLPPFRIWKGLRDGQIANADLIFTECSLYRTLLDSLPEDRTRTLHWYKADTEGLRPAADASADAGTCTMGTDSSGTDSSGTDASGEMADKPLRIAYMGAVNNIIHIPLITEVLQCINDKRRVSLTVIGEGERTEEFLESVRKAGIEVDYRGAIYDEKKKNDLLRSCSYGLNLMKPEVRVGLTMKSIDYLYCGLPLISNIKGDTEQLIREEGIGVHVDPERIREAAAEILLKAGDPELRIRARSTYEAHFTEEHFESVLREGLDSL